MSNSESRNNQNRGPGGDGGKVFIFAKEIRGDGKILADGGDGSIGGKGGEVHIVTEKNDYAGEVSARGGKSDNIPLSPKKIDWQKWAVIVSIIIFVLGFIANYFIQRPTTSYAPQTAKTKTGDVIQVQGNGNTIIATPNHEPITQYNILTTSERLDDGLFHAKIEVLVSFDKQGGLHISPKIYCGEYKDRERRPFQFEGGVYSGLVFNLDCKSSEPIQKGSDEYFKYINNE